MAYEFPPIDQKGKIALAIAVAILAGAGAYWYYLWSPDQVGIVQAAAHADTLETANSEIKKAIADGLESKLKADAIKFTNELSGLRRLVPTENEVPALVDNVSMAARAAGMEISEFSPLGTLSGQDFDMVKYHFAVTGPFHKVVEFLTAIASSPRILTPINVNVSTSARVMERKPGKGETFVDVKFDVMTYVAKTKPLGPTPAPAKPTAPPAKPGTK
jgi:type IV pilus assembly protein PilO